MLVSMGKRPARARRRRAVAASRLIPHSSFCEEGFSRGTAAQTDRETEGSATGLSE